MVEMSNLHLTCKRHHHLLVLSTSLSGSGASGLTGPWRRWWLVHCEQTGTTKNQGGGQSSGSSNYRFYWCIFNHRSIGNNGNGLQPHLKI